VAEEAQGQVAEQPTPMEMALQIARAELGEDKPRDEQGRFAKPATEEAKPEEEAPKEEVKEETQEEPPQPEVRKHKLKVKTEEGSDEEIEVDEEELKRGYMKSKDYSVKTAQLAREREAVQAKVREAVEPKLKEYETQLETYKQTVIKLADPEAMNADLNKLAEEDPARAQKLFFKRIEIQNTLKAIEAEQAKVAEERGKEARASMQKQAQQAVEILKTDISGWGDELYGKILKTGVSEYGFKPEEVNAITDHRAIKVLHDAMQYRALKSAKPVVEKRAAAAVPKVVKPGTTEKPDATADKWSKGVANLRKSGNMKDAVPLAMQILEREGIK
jgi:hypothetical protein